VGKPSKSATVKAKPSLVAADIRCMLKGGGSPEHAKGVQWFFKDEIKSHGWHTAGLRKTAVLCRRTIVNEQGQPCLLQVADKLFSGNVLEEKVFAVLMLERMTDDFGDPEFRLFESWLSRISSWADHDALVHSLIAPMVAAKPSRTKTVFRWAKSRHRWLRRAACVALIRGARQKMFFAEIRRLTAMLLCDEDDMVQKGLGWLLREAAKSDAKKTVPFLMSIRGECPRLVLRTACETLPEITRKRLLAKV